MIGAIRRERARGARKRRRGAPRHGPWQLHLMLWPGVILLLIFHYTPILGTVIAFQNYVPIEGFLGSQWVGLANFQFIFGLPSTFQVIWNTVFISGLKIIGELTVPVIVALLLNEVRTRLFQRTVQTAIFLPHFLSWVILGGVMIELLSTTSGPVASLFHALGQKPIPFLGSAMHGSRTSWPDPTPGRSSGSTRSSIWRRCWRSIRHSMRRRWSTAPGSFVRCGT